MPRPIDETPPTTPPSPTDLARAGEIFTDRGRFWFSNTARVYTQITMLPKNDQGEFLLSRFGGSINHIGTYRRWIISGSPMRAFLASIAPYITTDSAKRIARLTLRHDLINEEEEQEESSVAALEQLSPRSAPPEQSNIHHFTLTPNDFEQIEQGLRPILETPESDGGPSAIICTGLSTELSALAFEVELQKDPPAGLSDLCTVERDGLTLTLNRL